MRLRGQRGPLQRSMNSPYGTIERSNQHQKKRINLQLDIASRPRPRCSTWVACSLFRYEVRHLLRIRGCVEEARASLPRLTRKQT